MNGLKKDWKEPKQMLHIRITTQKTVKPVLHLHLAIFQNLIQN